MSKTIAAVLCLVSLGLVGCSQDRLVQQDLVVPTDYRGLFRLDVTPGGAEPGAGPVQLSEHGDAEVSPAFADAFSGCEMVLKTRWEDHTELPHFAPGYAVPDAELHVLWLFDDASQNSASRTLWGVIGEAGELKLSHSAFMASLSAGRTPDEYLGRSFRSDRIEPVLAGVPVP